jgi:subtilisin family serine protease
VSGNGRGSVDVDDAVIDTGISTSHPELNVAGGKACNGSGFNDQNGHGSHVAGIIGARDNRNGVVGVAPGARLWAVRVLNAQGSGSFAQVICGIDWVTAHASTIEVANMSLGGPGFDPGAGCSTGDALHVDLIAPGVCILSTFRGTGYATLSGTSMASPHVAGAAALYKSTHPAASPAAVKAALQAAGNLNWNASDDPDGIKETLLNVDAL